VMGVPGVLVGLTVDVVGFYVMITFQVLVLEFAIVFFYLNVLAPVGSPSLDNPTIPAAPSDLALNEIEPIEGDGEDGASAAAASKEPQPVMAVPIGMGETTTTVKKDGAPPHVEVFDTGSAQRLYTTYGLMAVCAFAGGFLTAKVGSGSDIMLFAYGHFVWNVLVPERAFKDNQLTASSVITMGLLSAVTALCRTLTRQVTQRVYEVWGATAWLVVFGAPCGSLLLTPGLQASLRIAFYILAIGQFVGFAVLKIGPNPNSEFRTNAWLILIVATAALTSLILVHFNLSARRLRQRAMIVEPVSVSRMLARLLPGQFGSK